MRELQYYRPNHSFPDGNTVLISGQCPRIKGMYLAGQLRQAAQSGYKAVVIDFGRTGNRDEFSNMLGNCGYTSRYTFEAGKDNYALRETSFCLL